MWAGGWARCGPECRVQAMGTTLARERIVELEALLRDAEEACTRRTRVYSKYRVPAWSPPEASQSFDSRLNRRLIVV